MESKYLSVIFEQFYKVADTKEVRIGKVSNKGNDIAALLTVNNTITNLMICYIWKESSWKQLFIQKNCIISSPITFLMPKVFTIHTNKQRSMSLYELNGKKLECRLLPNNIFEYFATKNGYFYLTIDQKIQFYSKTDQLLWQISFTNISFIELLDENTLFVIATAETENAQIYLLSDSQKQNINRVLDEFYFINPIDCYKPQLTHKQNKIYLQAFYYPKTLTLVMLT